MLDTENNATTSQFEIKGVPTSNIIKKKELQERVAQVFKELGEILSRSFGAYGAPTVISNLKDQTVTKDGYTIMKNLIFDTEKGSPIDHIIYKLASTVCERLNYKVGDGTTTAIVAVNAIYDAFIELQQVITESGDRYLPRDIMTQMKIISEELCDELEKKSIPIRRDENLYDDISKIVNISSNGNKEITEYIASAYKELGGPSINCEISPDGETGLEIIDGYQMKIALADAIYVDNDGGFAELTNVDVIIFDHAITGSAYEKIIKPLWAMCNQVNRKLVVVAPTYDQNALHTVIKRDIMEIFNKTGKLSLVLTVLTAMTANTKIALGDLAVLLGTVVIDRILEYDIIKATNMSENPVPIQSILDIYSRKIPGLEIVTYTDEECLKGQIITDDGKTDYNYGISENAITIGFIENLKIDLKRAIFSGFHYNELLFEKIKQDADRELQDSINRLTNLSLFSYEVSRNEQRVNSLKLKTARIEVGGESRLTQCMLKDSVDDSIRAAESAFNNGYILGCNVTTLQIITEMWQNSPEETPEDRLRRNILNALFRGFSTVYQTVLKNAYDNIDAVVLSLPPLIEKYHDKKETKDFYLDIMRQCLSKLFITELEFDEDALFNSIISQMNFESILEEYNKYDGTEDEENRPQFISINVAQIFIGYSILTGKVLDLTTTTFSDDIINSVRTDIEVVAAIIDLMSILFNGNQMVILSKEFYHNS